MVEKISDMLKVSLMTTAGFAIVMLFEKIFQKIHYHDLDLKILESRTLRLSKQVRNFESSQES